MGNILSLFFPNTNTSEYPLNSCDVATDEECDGREDSAIVFTEDRPKLALLVGINYNEDNDRSNDLRGCESDLLRISKVLMGKYNFKADDVNILNSKTATKESIESSLLNMVMFARRNSGAELFFHFSGHGTQQSSYLEKDRKSEYLCPVDYAINGLISDRWMKMFFVNRLPADCKLFCLVDCCHSGTNMNLCYNYDFERGSLERDGDYKEAKANVIKISGCLDEQVSYDCYNSDLKIFNGALTDAFIVTCQQGVNVVDHVKTIRQYLIDKKFPQTPNLTMSGKLTNWKLY